MQNAKRWKEIFPMLNKLNPNKMQAKNASLNVSSAEALLTLLTIM